MIQRQPEGSQLSSPAHGMTHDRFSQAPYQCRFDWGISGTLRAVSRGDVVLLVDVLSFSTSTAIAVSRGALIYPCAITDDPREIARQIGGEAAVDRNQVPAAGKYSLSPGSLVDVNRGQRIVIPSLNGATCSRSATHATITMTAALVNAGVTARVISAALVGRNRSVTIVACGEREKESNTGDLRMAIEDYLGAGAIIARLDCTKSPEAQVAEAAFRNCKSDLQALLWDSVSGRELRAIGFGEDVKCAANIDSVDAVPVLKDGFFVRMEP
jgi:2-phosphosulfolactate phosphatase